MTHKYPLYVLLALMLLGLTTACHDDKDEDDDTVYTYSTSQQTTLVTTFMLKANSAVLSDLDSVHFTIDPDQGLIYNADSLPVGTDVSALLATIRFNNTVNNATITISGATKQSDTTFVYSTSSNDSIDFTGKVSLTVTSYDKSQVKEYDVRVNVHQVNPDSMVWNAGWRRPLPGSTDDAVAQKTVAQGDVYRCLVQNGTAYALSTAASPGQEQWDTQAVVFPFQPQVKTFTATSDAMYILSDAGALYATADGQTWTACGVTWHSVIGAYGMQLLGIVLDQGTYKTDIYPRPSGFEPEAVPAGFPVSGFSPLVPASNDWTVALQMMMVGGITADGSPTNNVWGYDGSQWGLIADSRYNAMPAMSEVALFPYYVYRKTTGQHYVRQAAWMVMGGRLADGSLNATTYLSTNQGISWGEAADAMQQPAHIAAMCGAQAFVTGETLSLPAGAPRRVSTAVTSWICPYVYVFGGYGADGTLQNNVWRGVLNRLTFEPVY